MAAVTLHSCSDSCRFKINMKFLLERVGDLKEDDKGFGDGLL